MVHKFEGRCPFKIAADRPCECPHLLINRSDLVKRHDVVPNIAISPFLGKLLLIEIMRTVVLVALVAWNATNIWAQSNKDAKPETLLRWSFIGTKQLAAEKNLTVFNEVRSLPETTALRDAAALNLARHAASRFTSGKTNAHPHIAPLIQSLIPDLLQNESRFQMDSQGGQDADWMLALRLPDAASKEWSRSLVQLATSAEMKGAAADKSEWVASRDRYKLSFSRSKDWTVIQGGYGGSDSKSAKDFRASLGKRSGKAVLDAEVNTPLLGKIWGASNLAHYPKFSLKAEPRNDGFQSELILDYPQDLGIKPEKWNVPASLITEPLIGFTAVQGVQKKLDSLQFFRALGAKQTPNQLFLWSQGLAPFSVSFAAEVRNPAAVVTNLHAFLENKPLPSGTLQRPTNVAALIWTGLPIATPFVELAAEPHNSFLVGGLFRTMSTDGKPVPAELLAQLNQKNLVYYDWEITADRLRQWIPIRQLFYIVGGKLLPANVAPSVKFLQAIKGKLGNTATAGTLENPRRIKFTRQSHVGLSALELVLLVHAVDSEDLRLGTPAESNSTPAAPVPVP